MPAISTPIRRHRRYDIVDDSVSDPKRLFPDPTLKGIPDLDPTLLVFADPIPDAGQNATI